jgi:alpha-galactosidase
MPDATTLAQGIVSEDKTQGLFIVSQLAMPDYTLMMPLRMPGLEASAQYRISLLDHPEIRITGEEAIPCASCRRGWKRRKRRAVSG